MKKIAFLYFFLFLFWGSAYAQKFSLVAGYSLLKMPTSNFTTENTYTTSRYVANPSTRDTYTVIRIKAKFTSSQNVTYSFNNGFTTNLNMQWNKGEKWSFNSGIGVNYYDFTALMGNSAVSEQILSTDTVNRKYTFTNIDIASGYTYKYKDFPSTLKEGVNFKTLYLSIPFSVGYEVEKDRFGAEIGGQLSTLLRGKSIQEKVISQYDYDEKAKAVWVSYKTQDDIRIVNNNLSTFGFSYFAQLNYKYKNLGVNLTFAQNLTNLFHYNTPIQSDNGYDVFGYNDQYSTKPTSYTIKFVYYLGKKTVSK